MKLKITLREVPHRLPAEADRRRCKALGLRKVGQSVVPG